MDGVYNARLRARALKATLDAEYVEIGSLIDFGFGLGGLFRAMIEAFTPHTVVGIEPSPPAFAWLDGARLTDTPSTQITLLPVDLLTWCQRADASDDQPFDLGICTSVFQYLSDPELEQIVSCLAQRVQYLYFAVPTEYELTYQAVHLDLDDRYAISRTRDEYLALLRPYFTFVANRLLESRVHFDAENSPFYDMLFRF